MRFYFDVSDVVSFAEYVLSKGVTEVTEELYKEWLTIKINKNVARTS